MDGRRTTPSSSGCRWARRAWMSIERTSMRSTRRDGTLQYTPTGKQSPSSSPPVVRYQGDLIEATLRNEPIGQSGVTDLLFINYKAPDYTGHMYNMLSEWEGLILEEVDAQLGRLVATLDELFPDEYVLIATADHGQCPLPDSVGGVRLDPIQLGDHIEAEFGRGPFNVVQSVVPSEVYLHSDVLWDNGASLEDVAAYLRDYRYRQNIGPYVPASAIEQDLLDQKEFSAVFATSYLATSGRPTSRRSARPRSPTAIRSGSPRSPSRPGSARRSRRRRGRACRRGGRSRRRKSPGTSISPSPCLLLGRGFDPSATTPRSRRPRAAESRTHPLITSPAHPLAAASPATLSPTRATRNEPPPSTTRTRPSPGSPTRCFTSTLSSKHRTVATLPSKIRAPPKLTSGISHTAARSPCSSRRSAVAVKRRAYSAVMPDPVLTDEDRAMLEGERGDAVALAMRILVEMARVWEAERLIDITSAHIDSCLYHGRAGLDFAERLAEGGARVVVPTTLNVSSLDLLHPELVRLDAETAADARRLMDAYVAMGCRPTWTCAPYQLPERPAFGEHVAWAESNAIVFANSVLGARTNRYGDFIDICAAITGRAPLAGLHLDANRRATVVFRLDGVPERLLRRRGHAHLRRPHPGQGGRHGGRRDRRAPARHRRGSTEGARCRGRVVGRRGHVPRRGRDARGAHPRGRAGWRAAASRGDRDPGATPRGPGRAHDRVRRADRRGQRRHAASVACRARATVRTRRRRVTRRALLREHGPRRERGHAHRRSRMQVSRSSPTRAPTSRRSSTTSTDP